MLLDMRLPALARPLRSWRRSPKSVKAPARGTLIVST